MTESGDPEASSPSASSSSSHPSSSSASSASSSPSHPSSPSSPSSSSSPSASGAPPRAERGPVPHISVITSGHDVADARLHREVAAFVRAGLVVEVLGLGDPAQGPAGALVRTWPRRGPVGRAALACRMAARARGRVVMSLDPDSAVAAAGAVWTSGRRMVVDVHEDYAALLADRPWARRYAGALGHVGRGVVAAFHRVAVTADLTVVADEHVPPHKARRRLVVRNTPDPALLPGPTARGPTPRALYVGDVRATRGLFVMIEALRDAPDWRLDVVGPVAPADGERLARVLDSDPALADRVVLHGRLAPAEAWQVARGAWAGLLLLADTPAFRDAVPSKLDEYLACGLAVVASDLPRQCRLLAECGAGAVVDGWALDGSGRDERDVARDVAACLSGWSAEPAGLDALRAAAREHAARPQARSGYDELAGAVAALL